MYRGDTPSEANLSPWQRATRGMDLGKKNGSRRDGILGSNLRSSARVDSSVITNLVLPQTKSIKLKRLKAACGSGRPANYLSVLGTNYYGAGILSTAATSGSRGEEDGAPGMNLVGFCGFFGFVVLQFAG
jgi:hypothetical protein